MAVPKVSDTRLARNSDLSEPDAANLLDDITALILRYAIFNTEHEARAVALFTLSTYARNADSTSIFYVTPYLYIRSRGKKHGKTRVIEIMRRLVCNPSEHMHRPTEAVLFRLVSVKHPVIFMDEIHHMINGPEGDGILGILNGGNFGDGVTMRCDPRDANGFIEYRIGGEKVLAGRDITGTLPDETVSRTIIIDMPHEPNASAKLGRRFSIETYITEAKPITDRCANWFSGNADALAKAPEPEYPAELTDDRTAEAWRGLLVIATHAGSRWLAYAHNAVMYLASGETEHSQSDELPFNTAVETAMIKGYIRPSAYDNAKKPPSFNGLVPADFGWGFKKTYNNLSIKADEISGEVTLRTDNFESFWHAVKRANNGHGITMPNTNTILRELRESKRLTADGRGLKTRGKVWQTEPANHQIFVIDMSSHYFPNGPTATVETASSEWDK